MEGLINRSLARNRYNNKNNNNNNNNHHHHHHQIYKIQALHQGNSKSLAGSDKHNSR
jgi:hypothetical protein